jgi:uncharacterized membrane protein YqaE (UPF0057 family)
MQPEGGRSCSDLEMGLLRAIVCVLLPPLAVLDRGCGAILITTLLTLAGWVPGIIAAVIFNLNRS